MPPNVCRLTPALKRYVQHQWRVIDVLFAKINTATSDELHELQTAKTKLEYVMATGTVPESDKDQLKPVITLTNAPNVFQEAWADGGIPADLNPDKFAERKIDLEQLIQTSIDAFNQAGLNEWVADIEKARAKPEFQEKMENLEEDPVIRNYLMQGYEIIGIMPGKQAQLNQMKTALTQLRPTIVEGGVTKVAKEGNIAWPHIEMLLTNKSQELVLDVPDKPYLLLTPPTKRPHKDTTSKSINAQKEFYTEVKRTSPELGILTMAELTVTQKCFADSVNSQTNLPSNKKLSTYTPLDKNTFTRFPNITPTDGSVPYSVWGGGGLQFDRFHVGAVHDAVGFRFSVRAQI